MYKEQSIIERLEVLEKQNRRIKQIGIAGIVIVASLFLMGQKAVVNRTVEANRFILRDGNGKERAIWGTDDAQGTPNLIFLDAKGAMRVLLVIDKNDSPKLSMFNGKGSMLAIEGNQYGVGLTMTGHPEISMSGDAPAIEIEDKEGFQSVMGSTALITPSTGETHQTSAASVILFGKDKKILWKAP